jgi:condensation enzyme
VKLTDHDAPASTQPSRLPLSLNQQFVCLFDQGDEDGPFGPRYHMAAGWRVRGRVDDDALGRALYDLVVRHEALRTLIAADPVDKCQMVYPPTAPELVIREFPADSGMSRDEQADQLIRQVESETISPQRVPLLRVVLSRFDDSDAVLVLLVHHLGTDGWSMRVIMRDLAVLYAAQCGHDVSPLPEAPQYRVFSEWQRSGSASPAASREYWRRRLDGARLTAIPTTFARSEGLPQSTATHRFLIPADVVSSVTDIAHAVRSSPFMLMLAAYMIVVSRMTNTTDLVVPTLTPGRGDGLFPDTVGSCFNLVPLRTDVADCKTFIEVLERTRRTCLEGYSNDIPSIDIFAEAPELMLPGMSDRAAAVPFQIFPDPVILGDDVPGGLTYTEVTRRLISQPLTSAIPEGALWTLVLDPSGDAIGYTSYKRNQFDETTIADMVGEFQRVLRTVAAAPESSPGLSGR